MKYTLLLGMLSFLVACGSHQEETTQEVSTRDTLPEIKYRRSSVDFSLLIRDSVSYRALTFSKSPDSTAFSHMKYYCNCGEAPQLKEEVKNIAGLWQVAQDSIDIQLGSVDVGYPLLYKDVLQKQISAFVNDKRWQDYVHANGKTLNYSLMKQVMLDSGVYDALTPLLQSHGYEIDHFSTEKHGFVIDDILQKEGFDGSEIVPMPYIVAIVLRKSED